MNAPFSYLKAVFSTIWYLFLIAIVLQFGKRKKKIRSLGPCLPQT
jgi:uncharacterized membrane protein YfhO